MHALPEMKTPHKIGTGQKSDLTAIHPWGCKAWVKRLDVGKLEPRAEECRSWASMMSRRDIGFIGLERTELVVERDVYFNESEALEPEEAPVEGRMMHLPTRSIPIHPTPLEIIQNLRNLSTMHQTCQTRHVNLKTSKNTPKIHPEMHQTPPETPIPAPHQRSR